MKRIVISDIHFGEKNNSPIHNNDLHEFGDWLLTDPHFSGINELIVTGDVFHHRDQINVATLNSAIDFFDALSKRFNVRVLVGNHDMYYRDNRSIHSLKSIINNVDVIEDFVWDMRTAYIPWVISQEEYDFVCDKSKKDKTRLMYGHYEFSTFKMNDNYIMTGGRTHKALSSIDLVVTGHYHARQEKDNIVYVGSPFQFDMNDANDFARGAMIVDEEDRTYKWVDYKRIAILSLGYKQFLKADFNSIPYDVNRVTVRVVIDDVIDQKTTDMIRTKMKEHNFRDTRIKYDRKRIRELMESQNTEEDGDDSGITLSTEDVKNIDKAVIKMITNMDSHETINKEILAKIYEKVSDNGQN